MKTACHQQAGNSPSQPAPTVAQWSCLQGTRDSVSLLLQWSCLQGTRDSVSLHLQWSCLLGARDSPSQPALIVGQCCCLHTLGTHLFSLYWVWYSLSCTAVYSFWYLSSCSRSLQTSVVKTLGKSSACCRRTCCCWICSVKRLAFSSSCTSDSCVLGYKDTDSGEVRTFRTPLPTPYPPLFLRRIGSRMGAYLSCSYPWIQFDSVIHGAKSQHRQE